ncbi:MAG: periplasmic heavy metal sensor [Myxococcaceae bacterium]|nr:periplasmic heavy metal sensor [Myxococcaceae bacterium]MCI0673965.1 periplasmic heavy metal sensor [Myxococcaceae bacterium]
MMVLGLVAGGLGAFLAVRWMHWRRCHGRGWGHRVHGHAGWRRHRMRWLFQHMDATPAQERVLLAATDEVTGAWEALTREMRGWREDAARAVQGEHLDSQPLRDRFVRQDAALEELRRTLLGSLAKVHETLEPDQRRTLARALER